MPSVNLNCQSCNEEYKLPLSKAKNSKFCSKLCKDRANKKYLIKKCGSCKEDFKSKRGSKFCSRACYLKVNKKERVNLTKMS